jgi:hypothetical protein
VSRDPLRCPWPARASSATCGRAVGSSRLRASRKSLNEPGAVFLTLRRDGRLRGCIGRFVAARPRLVDELLGVAILAATRDPRYTPVRPDELTDLRYEVSLLGELEPVTGLADLDPRVYGLMVQAERRRGGLTPARSPGRGDRRAAGRDRADQGRHPARRSRAALPIPGAALRGAWRGSGGSARARLTS